MPNRNANQENKTTQRTANEKWSHDTLVEWYPPPRDNMVSMDLIAKLGTEQRRAITEFVEVTKEPFHVAVRLLQEHQWDLLEAIGQFFGEDDEQQDEDNDDTPPPAIEVTRSLDIPEFIQRKPSERICDYPSLQLDMRRTILETATAENGKENPRSARAVIIDPIATLEYNSSAKIAPLTCMFVSPYPDKLWYTGFMKP